MPAVLRRTLLTLCLLAPLAAGAQTPLPPALAEALRSADLPAQHAAFFVQPVDSPRPLLVHNGRQPMNPASVMKLVTAYAALELLGPAYAWETQALADAPVDGGRLAGNLYLRGGGDPTLTAERFWNLLRQLRSRGLTAIDGDLVLDRSRFRLPPHDPAAFDAKPLRPYNVGADALAVDFASVRLMLQADAAGRRIRVVNDTPAAALQIDNRLTYADEACGDWREKLSVAIDGDRLTLSGRFPAACGDKAYNLVPWPADRQVEHLFRTLWGELGGRFSGRVYAGTAPATAQRLLTYRSPPLAEAVRDMNKWSNNLIARQLLLTLAAGDDGVPATPEAARARLASWLTAKGIDGVTIDNGAGLSRDVRISAEALGRLLLAAWKSPVMPELMASLPIAGSDGTLKKRLGDSAAAGQAHLKTGYIEGVRSLAGYVLDRSGRRWVVVGFLNDPHMKNGSAPLDALVRWVAER